MGAQPHVSKELLEELKRRLTRPATCEPRCVTNPALALRLGDERLQLTAEVHAAADGSWALPGPLGSWAPSQLRLDGAPAVAVAHLEDGFLHLRLARGVHRIEAEGPLPAGDTLTLAFAVPPRRAQATAPGWNVSGLRGDGPPEASVLFTRRLGRHAVAGASEGRYAPWLEIRRTIGFGVTWTVETTVRRLTPTGTPVAVRVPLLPGEAPTEADFVTEGGEVAISLASDEQETSWESTLAQAPEITLTAPQGRPWSEVWRLECSAIWPCTAAGLPPVSRFAEGVLTPEYRPWPGEALKVSLRHPSGAEGQTLTIDSVRLASEPGTRLDRVTLFLQARSSREQPSRGPPAAGRPRSRSSKLDGRDRASRPENGELRLTVPAGSHRIELRWQQPTGLGVFYSLPRVGLSVPAVNVTQQVSLPPERWLLFTRGPSWGPAVLFWPYLLFVVAVGLLLGRVPGSPLAGRHWVLLGLGLSQLPALAALVVVGFVFALARRAERPMQSPSWFDAAAADARRLGAGERAGALRGRPHRSAAAARHAGGGRQQQRREPRVVLRPRQRRTAGRWRPERPALGLPRADAALGAMAGQGPGARRGLGLGRVRHGWLLAPLAAGAQAPRRDGAAASRAAEDAGPDPEARPRMSRCLASRGRETPPPHADRDDHPAAHRAGLPSSSPPSMSSAFRTPPRPSGRSGRVNSPMRAP